MSTQTWPWLERTVLGLVAAGYDDAFDRDCTRGEWQRSDDLRDARERLEAYLVGGGVDRFDHESWLSKSRCHDGFVRLEDPSVLGRHPAPSRPRPLVPVSNLLGPQRQLAYVLERARRAAAQPYFDARLRARTAKRPPNRRPGRS
jgi:hypothetical protein